MWIRERLISWLTRHSWLAWRRGGEPPTKQQEAVGNIFTHPAKAKFDMIKVAHPIHQLKLYPKPICLHGLLLLSFRKAKNWKSVWTPSLWRTFFFFFLKLKDKTKKILIMHRTTETGNKDVFWAMLLIKYKNKSKHD